MPAASSYQPLADYLASKKADLWEATFGDIEAKLGRPLPRSAYRHQAWWANQNGPGHSQTHGWKSVGWRTTKLDLERRRVTFERDRRPASLTRGSGGAAPAIEKLVATAMEISGIDDRDSVVAAALQEFIHQQAVAAVAAMGGSQPDFEPAPRERPWG